MQYTIICRQGAGFSSWEEPRSEQEIIDLFYGYAEDDGLLAAEELAREHFTLDFIAEGWQVDFQEVPITQGVSTHV